MAGYGDELLATGLARGAAARGKRIAFGDGNRIIWGPHSAEIFKGNPNIAPQHDATCSDLEWIPFYKGSRSYVKGGSNGLVFNRKFRPTPGEVFFDRAELAFIETIEPGFILIEPNLPWHKVVAFNKDWGFRNHQAVASAFLAAGYPVAQFSYGRDRLMGVRTIQASSFRLALAALTRARLAIVPEGGMHHGAAAIGIKAVVLFGGFIPPSVTGYDTHANLTGGAKACGRIGRCQHCVDAMRAISVDDVLSAADGLMVDDG